VNRIILIAALMTLLTSCGNLFSSDRGVLQSLFASKDTRELELTLDPMILGAGTTLAVADDPTTSSAVEIEGFVRNFVSNQLIFNVGLDLNSADAKIEGIKTTYRFRLVNDGRIPPPPSGIVGRPSTGRSEIATFEVPAPKTGLGVLKARLEQLGIRGKIKLSSERVADFLNAISVVHGETISLNTLSYLN
jgi:hypothetical protein